MNFAFQNPTNLTNGIVPVIHPIYKLTLFLRIPKLNESVLINFKRYMLRDRGQRHHCRSLGKTAPQDS